MVSMIVRKVVKSEMQAPGLGERIRQAQKDSGKSIEQVIREVGISRTYWNSLIKEKVDAVAYELLGRIEESLGVDFGVSFD